MRNKIKRLFLVVTTISLFASVLVAQEGSKPRRWGIPEKPQNSETNAVHMEQVRALMQEVPNPDSVIILIARLGRGETRRELNRRRLYNMSFRYKVTLGFPSEKVVAAEGERVDNYGRVEIYWNGEMIGALPVSKNRDIYVDCCGPDDRYYPEKDAVDRQQSQKAKRKRRG